MYTTPMNASATVGTGVRFGVEGGATRERGRGGGQEWKKRDSRAISVTCRSKSAKCCITQFMHETWRYRAAERGTAPTENTRTDPSTPNTTPSDLTPKDISTPRPRTAPHEQPPRRRTSSTKTQVEHATNTMAEHQSGTRFTQGEPPRRERPGETRPPGRHPPKPTRPSPSPGSAFPERPTEHAHHTNPPSRVAEDPRRHTTADTTTPPTKTHVREGVPVRARIPRPQADDPALPQRPLRDQARPRGHHARPQSAHRTPVSTLPRRGRAAPARVISLWTNAARRSDRRERTRSASDPSASGRRGLGEPLEDPGRPAQGPWNTKTPSPQAFPHRR